MTLNIHDHCWFGGKAAQVLDIRQHGYVEVAIENREVKMVDYRELRQCKCALAGEYHSHGGRKVRMYKVERP